MSVPSISRLSAAAASRWRRVSTCVENRARPAVTAVSMSFTDSARDVGGQLTSLLGVVDQAAEERAAAPLQPGDPLPEVLVARPLVGHPHHEAGDGGVAEVDLHRRVECRRQTFGEVGERHDGLLEDVVDQHLHLAVHRRVEVRLGRVVVVDRVGRGAGCLRDDLVRRGV